MNDTRIEEIMAELSLEDKASLCSGQGSWNTKAIKKNRDSGIIDD